MKKFNINETPPYKAVNWFKWIGKVFWTTASLVLDRDYSNAVNHFLKLPFVNRPSNLHLGVGLPMRETKVLKCWLISKLRFSDLPDIIWTTKVNILKDKTLSDIVGAHMKDTCFGQYHTYYWFRSLNNKQARCLSLYAFTLSVCSDRLSFIRRAEYEMEKLFADMQISIASDNKIVRKAYRRLVRASHKIETMIWTAHFELIWYLVVFNIYSENLDRLTYSDVWEELKPEFDAVVDEFSDWFDDKFIDLVSNGYIGLNRMHVDIVSKGFAEQANEDKAYKTRKTRRYKNRFRRRR